MSKITRLTKDVILFKKKIDQLVKILILNNYRKSHNEEVIFNLEMENYDLWFRVRENCLSNENLGMYPDQYIYQIYDKEIIKDKDKCKGFNLEFNKGNEYYAFTYFIYPELDGFFELFIPINYVPLSMFEYINDGTLVVANINKNQYLFKSFFIDFQKWIGINIFDFIDDIIWELI